MLKTYRVDLEQSYQELQSFLFGDIQPPSEGASQQLWEISFRLFDRLLFCPTGFSLSAWALFSRNRTYVLGDGLTASRCKDPVFDEQTLFSWLGSERQWRGFCGVLFQKETPAYLYKALALSIVQECERISETEWNDSPLKKISKLVRKRAVSQYALEQRKNFFQKLWAAAISREVQEAWLRVVQQQSLKPLFLIKAFCVFYGLNVSFYQDLGYSCEPVKIFSQVNTGASPRDGKLFLVAPSGRIFGMFCRLETTNANLESFQDSHATGEKDE